MSELLFVLVTIFVAYVVYTTVNDKAASTGVSAPDSKAAQKGEGAEVIIHQQEKKPANPIKLAVTAKSSDEIKNPKTGEVSKIPNNYRFGKRWIKEALVAEGLLSKVYKNNELDDAANEKVHAALVALKAMEKYQP